MEKRIQLLLKFWYTFYWCVCQWDSAATLNAPPPPRNAPPRAPPPPPPHALCAAVSPNNTHPPTHTHPTTIITWTHTTTPTRHDKQQRAGLASITPFYNVYFKSRGLSDTQIGVLSAVRQWVSVPSSFAWSAFADRTTLHQWTLAFVLVTSTASRLGLVRAGSFGALLGLIIINQFVTSPVTVMADAIVVSNCDEEAEYSKVRAW